MAEAIVCVSPGILDTNVMVAPNSPSALAKQSIAPAIMPGSARGNVMVRKTLIGLAPSVAAACSSFVSTASMESWTPRTNSGKPIIALAKAAPNQLKARDIPR